MKGHCARRPVDLKGLLAVKAAHPAAKLVVGNSEVGIEMKFKNAGYPILVGTTHVPELNQITVRSAVAARIFPMFGCAWKIVCRLEEGGWHLDPFIELLRRHLMQLVAV